MGFYGPGDTVSPPISPVDGYTYSYAECLFIPILYSSRSPAAGYVPGQATPPALANSDPGQGNLIVCPYQLDVNDANGKVADPNLLVDERRGKSRHGEGHGDLPAIEREPACRSFRRLSNRAKHSP